MARSSVMALVLAIALLATTAGCGDTAELTRAELLKQGDAICRRVAEKRDRIYIFPQDVREYVRVFPRLVAYERPAFRELEKLVPPTSMAHVWKQILATDRRAVEDSVKAAEYAQAGKSVLAGKAYASVTHDKKRAADLGRSNGFLYCSLVET
jgi:hypothetical protein